MESTSFKSKSVAAPLNLSRLATNKRFIRFRLSQRLLTHLVAHLSYQGQRARILLRLLGVDCLTLISCYRPRSTLWAIATIANTRDVGCWAPSSIQLVGGNIIRVFRLCMERCGPSLHERIRERDADGPTRRGLSVELLQVLPGKSRSAGSRLRTVVGLCLETILRAGVGDETAPDPLPPGTGVVAVLGLIPGAIRQAQAGRTQYGTGAIVAVGLSHETILPARVGMNQPGSQPGNGLTMAGADRSPETVLQARAGRSQPGNHPLGNHLPGNHPLGSGWMMAGADRGLETIPQVQVGRAQCGTELVIVADRYLETIPRVQAGRVQCEIGLMPVTDRLETALQAGAGMEHFERCSMADVRLAASGPEQKRAIGPALEDWTNLEAL